MDLVKSTNGSVNCLRGFVLAVIVGRIKNCMIDSDVVTAGSKPAVSFARTGSDVSVFTKRCCTEEARTSSKSASIWPLSTPGTLLRLLVTPPPRNG